MASLEEGIYNLKVNSKLSSYNFMHPVFAAGSEGQNETDEPNKVQNRKGRPQDSDTSLSNLKVLQEILEDDMVKGKEEAVTSVRSRIGKHPYHGERPARNATMFATQKEWEVAPEMNSSRDKRIIVNKNFSEEQPSNQSGVIFEKGSPPFNFLDDYNSHSVFQKQPSNQSRLIFEKGSPPFNFLDDYNSHSVIQKHKEKVVMEHPSSGSHWSDKGETTVIFSQEKPFTLCFPAVSEPTYYATDYTTFPPHYSSSQDYTSSWFSSTKSSCYPSLDSSSNTFQAENSSSSSSSSNIFQGERSSHQSSLSYYSTSFPVSSQKMSRDLKMTEEVTSNRSRLLDFSRNEEAEAKEERVYQEETLQHPYGGQASSFLPNTLWKPNQQGFIDAHCHLDVLYSRLPFQGDFTKFRQIYSSSFPEEFQGCISCFCNPQKLKAGLWEYHLKDNLVWGAFGCQPHFASSYNYQQEKRILRALQHPKAVAFGEMGLDYSHKCTTLVSEQQKVFKRQLRLAVSLKKPIMLHCREAEEDVLDILKKYVPPDHNIHRHCFTGSYAAIEPLLNHFPNLYVGFTAILTYSSAKEAREAVKKIPLERIIVETDAPFFFPRCSSKSLCPYTHPGLALHTVRVIAKIKKLSLSHTLATLRENTHRLYHL
ncbi:putative deoxyribonuclease TATDN2 [Plecturocebus cupreus]